MEAEGDANGQGGGVDVCTQRGLGSADQGDDASRSGSWDRTAGALDRRGRECKREVVRRIIAFALALVLFVGLTASAAYAGTATNVALGLASFAVFNQLFGGFAYARPVYVTPVYAAPVYPVYVERPIYYQQVYVPPPAPATYPTVVQYSHGRYELRGDGFQTPYQWVWIPNPPPPPPLPAAPPAPSP